MLHVFRLPMILRRSKAFRGRNVETNLCSKSVYCPPNIESPCDAAFPNLTILKIECRVRRWTGTSDPTSGVH